MKTNLIGRLVALGVVTSTIAGFGVKSYDTATGGALSNKINELKQLAITWKQNATAKDKLLSQKQTELEALQGKYNSILTLLGISDMNADENTIKEAINSMSSEQDLKDIATALGIADTASKEDILAEISVIGETMVTLKDSIDTLELTVSQLTAEIERLQGEVTSANNAESAMLLEVANAINDIGVPALEPGEEVEPVEPTLESVQAELDSIWTQFSTLVAGDSSNYTAGRVSKIKEGLFSLDNSDGYTVTVHNGADIKLEATEQKYNLLSEYKEKLDLYNSLLAQQ